MAQKRIDDYESEIYEIIDFIELIKGIRDNIHEEICDMPQKHTLSHYISILEEIKNDTFSRKNQSN